MVVEATRNLAWKAVRVRGVRWTAAPAHTVAENFLHRITVVQGSRLDHSIVAVLPQCCAHRIAGATVRRALVPSSAHRLGLGVGPRAAWARPLHPLVWCRVAREATAWVERGVMIETTRNLAWEAVRVRGV